MGTDEEVPERKTSSARKESSDSSKVRKDQLFKKRRSKDEQDGLVKGKKPITSILRKPKGSAGGTDQSSSDSAEDTEKPQSLKVDLSASDSSQGSTKNRGPLSKGPRKKRPTSRQPPTKSPAIYDEVHKEQVFKGRTISQIDPYQSGGEGGSQRKVSRNKHQSDLVDLVPRGRVTKGGSASSWAGKHFRHAGDRFSF